MIFFFKIFFLFLIIFFTNNLNANNLSLKKSGVKIEYTNSNGIEKQINIKRIHNKICKKLRASPKLNWGENYASKDVNDICKKTYITSVGVITPINMNNGVTTIGELELINFMQEAQLDDDMLLIDARLEKWYKVLTIPSAVNIPFNQIDEEQYEYENILVKLGVKIKDDIFDFSNVKSLAFIDNGPWCMQSTWAIQNLLKIGYPANKIFWYRAGLQGWSILGLTTIKP